MIDILKNKSEIPATVNSVSVITGESVAGFTEDSNAAALGEKFGYTAVFDGCGISGSSIYPCFNNQTGSYIAANVAACAAVDLFSAIEDKPLPDADTLAGEYKKLTDEYLSQFREVSANDPACARVKPARLFPTSASVTYYDYSQQNSLGCTFLWAGDCRGYILDRKGLAVVTTDDLAADDDAGLSDDTRLTNVIRADSDYRINTRTIESELPVITVNATSGCYRLFSNPAELEFMLLYTLDRSKSISRWEKSIGNYLKELANDDYTLSVAAFGFAGFDEMRSYYRKRMDDLLVSVIDPLKKISDDDGKNEILGEYNSAYTRYSR